MGRKLGYIGRIGVHLVARVGLRGSAVATAIVRDHSVTLMQKEQHLRIPVVRTERPAVVENDGLTGAPVLIKNLGSVARLEYRHAVLLLRRRKWPPWTGEDRVCGIAVERVSVEGSAFVFRCYQPKTSSRFPDSRPKGLRVALRAWGSDQRCGSNWRKRQATSWRHRKAYCQAVKRSQRLKRLGAWRGRDRPSRKPV
jgi:hypothetical protein